MTREELIKKVALKMDEISSSDDVIESVGTGDNNPLYTQINNLLNESINDVLMKAPLHRIQSMVRPFTDARMELVFYLNKKVAIFDVPEDFIKLAYISHNLFYRDIVDLALEGDATDKRQHNIHLVAGYAKPVAVLERKNGLRIIKCYSFNTNENVSPVGYYVKRYDSDKNDPTVEVGLDDYLTDIVSWLCAGKVFYIQGDVNKGKICEDNAASIMI